MTKEDLISIVLDDPILAEQLLTLLQSALQQQNRLKSEAESNE